jgi:thiol-disulfide isomerase/thioredoxin
MTGFDRKVSLRIVCVGVVAGAVLALAVGGCAASGSQPLLVDSQEGFQQQIIQADKPVLVMFFKQGCPACIALEPTFNQLAKEYEGRAVIARYKHLSATFAVTSKELKDRYDVSFVPTVLLFVKGQEVQRWFSDYNINNYRRGLERVLSTAASQP